MKSPTITGSPGSSTVHRRQPLLRKTTTKPSITKRCETLRKRKGEVAGRTAAECATVCCCLPCAMMHFLILAVYKVPTGLCRKMLRKNKQKTLLNNNESKCGHGGAAVDGKESENVDLVGGGGGGGGGGKAVAVESEAETWDRFYGGGFWRNASQKKED